MSTRKIKDGKVDGEKVYFKGHAQATYMSDGRTVEEAVKKGCAYPVVNHGTNDTTFTLTPNTFHIWEEVAALDLSLGDETSGIANEFLFQFTSGATPTTLTLPDSIKWANDIAPAISENMIYQVSVLNGFGCVLEFNSKPSLMTNFGTYKVGDMMNGATLTFEYPIASDLTLSLVNTEYDTIVMRAGQTSITIDWFEPSAPVITGVNPEYDDTYTYILQ